MRISFEFTGPDRHEKMQRQLAVYKLVEVIEEHLRHLRQGLNDKSFDSADASYWARMNLINNLLQRGIGVDDGGKLIFDRGNNKVADDDS
jgi:CRISPR/Cas system Type II protein with McrA/HNH and RuvC-like nuclease domain